MSRVVRFACGKPTTNHRVNAAVIHYLLAAPCPTQHPSYHKRPRPSSFDAWFEDAHLFTASASALPMMRSVVSEILPAGRIARESRVSIARGVDKQVLSFWSSAQVSQSLAPPMKETIKDFGAGNQELCVFPRAKLKG